MDKNKRDKLVAWCKFHLTPNVHSRKLLQLTAPVVSAMVLSMLYNLADLFWVGRLGSDAVAAVGTTGFYMNLGGALFAIVTMGVIVKVSQAVGAGDTEQQKKYAAVGSIVGAVIATIYIAVQLIWAEELIRVFGIEDEHVNAEASSYMRILASGSIFLYANLLMTSILNAKGRTKLSFKAVLYGNVTNLVLDPIFIHVLKLGVDGAGYSTFIAFAVSSVYFAILACKGKEKGLLALDYKGLKIGHFWGLVKVGSASATQRILFTFIAIVIGRIVANFGTEAIAAKELGLHIESLTFMTIGGLQQAVSIVVGQAYGGGRIDEIRHMYRTAFRMGTAFATMTTVVFLIFSEQLIGIFVSDANTIDMGSSYLIIVGLSQLFMTMEIITGGAFNGMGMTHISAGISIVLNVLRIPLALVLCVTPLGVTGVWWSISLTTMAKGLIARVLFSIKYKQVATSSNDTNSAIK